jgi:hypothetical protein
MKGVPGIINMQEYGLICFDEKLRMPEDSTGENAKSLTGNYLSSNNSESLNPEYFRQKTREGWLPYISLDIIGNDSNLLLRCDRGKTNGNYFDVTDAIQVANQVSNVLATAHSRNILYYDHKIWHYYWNNKRLSVIDWNAGEMHSRALSDDEMRFDIVLLAARALFFMFTGRYPEGVSLSGGTRPEEIRAAPHSYKVKWEYDDNHRERIPKMLRQLLQSILAGEHSNAARLSDEFATITQKLG